MAAVAVSHALNATTQAAANITAHALHHRHVAGVDPSHGADTGLIPDTVKPFVIPVLGLIIGAAMMQVPKIADAGKLVLYFGAQSFMNIFMGWVMGTSVTVPKGTVLGDGSVLKSNLTGCPAGFALTAMQQVVSFIVFCVYFSAVYFTPYRYTPKKLNTKFEVFCVVIFGCVFALNIALNNFSLGYISIAVNLIIRSCLPLTTFLSQQCLALVDLYPFKPCRWKEISLMVIGVICAGVFTLAQIMASASSGHASEAGNQILGVVMCVASLLCGSLNLALAGVLGETKLNVYDTVAYMAIPATLFLLPIACFVQKPVPGEWPAVFHKDTMSDFEILKGVWHLNKSTMALLFLSGVLSFGYNIIQFSIVHTLSPSATAFGGNFNKAALIFMTLMLPFLQTHKNPGSPYIEVIWAAVLCNIAAFSCYSYLQIVAKREAAEKSPKLLDADVHKTEDSGSGESEDESSEGNCGACQ
jgi:drug/metabolite transporter (DMT)-like permease